MNGNTDHDQKRFIALVAQFALAGHALVRAKPTDGPTAFYAARWGYIKPLASLNAAERFLKQIGGRP
jgi:hypothetical protein